MFLLQVIARQTTLFSFDSNPIVYLFYGIAVSAAASITNERWILLALVAAFIVFLILVWWARRTRENRRNLGVAGIIEYGLILYQFLFAVFMGTLIISGFSAASNPDSLSGVLSSVPASQRVISLVFKEPIDPLTWHLLVDGSNTRRTKPLDLIFEYNDSVLVKDNNTGSIVKVSKDLLAGIVDDTHLDASKLPTITPTPTK